MREFLDERRPSGLSARSVTIEDKVFESTTAVGRKAVEDDRLELIRLRVRDLAFRDRTTSARSANALSAAISTM